MAKRGGKRVRPVPTPVADQVNSSAVNPLSLGVGSAILPTGKYVTVNLPVRVIREESKIYYSDGSIAENVRTHVGSVQQQVWVTNDSSK